MSHHFEIRRLHRTTTPYIYRQHKVVNSVEFTTLLCLRAYPSSKTPMARGLQATERQKAQSCL